MFNVSTIAGTHVQIRDASPLMHDELFYDRHCQCCELSIFCHCQMLCQSIRIPDISIFSISPKGRVIVWKFTVQTTFLALTSLLSHNLPKKFVVNILALDSIKYETSTMTSWYKFYRTTNSKFLVMETAVLTTNFKNLQSPKVRDLQTTLQLFLKLYSGC